MKNLLLIILLVLINSCNKENKTKYSRPSTLSTNPYLERAKLFKDRKIPDSAFYYFNLAKNEFLKDNDSLGAGRSLVNMGIIQTENGDFLGGIESSLEANKYIKLKKDSNVLRTLAANYNNLGIASNYLKYYDKSVGFYIKAINTAVDKEKKYIYYNNIGDILTTQGKYKEAIQYLEKAILSQNKDDYSRALNNLAKAKYLYNKNYNPLPEFNKALEIRKKENIGDGLNSSFETLSTYYLDKDKSLSLSFAKKMFQVASVNKSPDDQILALQRIIFLDPKNYLQYFQKFNFINDSLQTARNNDKNQFAFFRYDLEGERAKGEKLKADNEIQQARKNFILGFLVILLIVGFFWYRKRQIQLKQEKELEVKNTQLKISKKVHDVVANGLYHMMIDVQNNPEMDKTRILNDIEKMYEESRDISHENIVEEDFAMRFINMIMSYSSDQQKVLPVGYKESIWENISYNTQLELYYILREILVNMKKHSQAKLASVRFEKDNDNLKIRYTDNGVGINDSDLHKGTGIRNTENRIESIGGDIIFEKNPKGGLIIQITIPIQSKYV
ncbi:Histidine kinase-, DNA gyrase B-, and HSP90-like ATPase [Chryseobacterium wanjuense]|uniref:histidine kinase n=1 Tax=Chryseobacterium wanjuense TaxID=356305 RepID=A0A1I0RS37_9FLAO|nr:ATP-binding protein [Chryseobacterium wanjuense]SEW44099.1 Histidine kinase-, DNA gyrase B-, and HSP90-like ATPase [Chryseobacterium wanjuense]